MEVSSISAAELRVPAFSPAARTSSRGAPDQTPKEEPLAAREEQAATGETHASEPVNFAGASGIRLHVDAETKRIIAQIVDEDDNVVRQIPPEDALRIAAMTRELLGLLFDQSA
jgi:uncharacterized FlaG/YvyC family protein